MYTSQQQPKMFSVAVRRVNLLLSISGKFFQGAAVLIQIHENR
jgi:hypothetical protein